ncbi:isoprenylcysteine carboxylmethyltransferase family protein [Nitrosomonas sp.]|uniref:methyltransferase family protein n=1 Tax=Nitrosomonas sp. TaxID=42353 RepID=UPI001D816CCB|nr:isoprenylcysteine carboxylmethyltransferase family protein [Nitrosomonas sp.]MCB1948129.1 isoprenylcysteine carboxylmethyltransferase family protein [Nitrosomonas sp.]
MRRQKLLIPPALIWIVFAAAMWVLSVSVPVLLLKTEPHFVLPLILIAIGVIIITSCAVIFMCQKTTLNPMKPELTTTLIKTGLYQYSRNPIYLGFVIMLTGWGLYLNNAPGLILVVGFIYYMNRFQIEPEEESLSRIFGTEFELYKRTVRRWL